MTAPTARVRCVSLVVACCLLAAGCQRTSEEAANPDLVWAIGNNDVSTGLAGEIAERWNEQNRGSTVRVHRLPPGADDQRQVMATELNAEVPNFDILTLDVTQTGEFAESGWLVDLEEQRPRVKGSLPGPVQSCTWGEKLWAVPFISDAGFLYYRKDLVGEQAPTTWDKLVRVGLEKGREHDITPFVGQGAQYEGLVVNYLEYLSGAGGALFDREGTEVEYGGEPAQRALEFMRKAQQQQFYTADFDAMQESGSLKRFQDGDAVFMRNWPYAYAELKAEGSEVKDKFGIAPLPTFDGKGSSSIIGGSNLGVSRFSQNRKAATEFALFASTNPGVQHLVAKKYSRGPALASVYSEPDLANDDVMKTLGEILPQAKARPPRPDWSTVSDEIQQNIFPAYTGPADPEVAVREIRSFLELTTMTKR